MNSRKHTLSRTQKLQLQKELTELATDDRNENTELANSDMSDYLSLI